MGKKQMSGSMGGFCCSKAPEQGWTGLRLNWIFNARPENSVFVLRTPLSLPLAQLQVLEEIKHVSFSTASLQFVLEVDVMFYAIESRD